VDKPDSTSQGPVPATLDGSGAKLVRLPLPARPAQAETSPVASTRKRPDALWYALYFPQLQQRPQRQQLSILKQLAGLAQQVSASVSLQPLALVCEVRSSLKYFGGIESIHQRLQQAIGPALAGHDLPQQFLYAASPTISGSLLLARAGHNALVYRKDNLRSALGQLNSDVLQLSKEQKRRLANMGIRQLRDLWRLPTDGLRKRFGSDFINLLNKAVGKAPEPTSNYLPPPAFTTFYDLPYELENLDRLIPIADELLAQLCEFLRQRDLSVSQLLFCLQHEKRSRSEIRLGLRQASRSREHLLLLLETHFATLTIPAPVVSVRLEAEQFDAFSSHSDSLLAEDRASAAGQQDNKLNQFLEQLQARLGTQAVQHIHTVAQHCPEFACHQVDYGELEKPGPGIGAGAVTNNPRPLWLLPQPVQLVLRKGQLYHRKPITLVSGPERIETHWWSGTDVRRDYYVAREANGSRLWVYRDRGGERHWYLHGVFA
jgi:protein ImuB